MIPSPHTPDQNKVMQVLVVDDERLSSHNLGIQLKFVGEAPLMTTSENWREAGSTLSETGSLLAAVVGVIKKVGLQQILSDLHYQYPDLPILLIGSLSQAEANAIPSALQAKLHQLDAAELNYAALSEALRLARENNGLIPQHLNSRILSPIGSPLFRSLSGKTPAMQNIRQMVKQVAARDVAVLVLGESGTGKEVVARNLHYYSGRGEAPFIAVNCAAINADSSGVELFGQAATRMQQATTGLLEKADGGTVYFDEVGELPLSIQTILLRFLEDKTFLRTGSAELISTNVKIVAGSGQNLEQKIKQGLFRKDLFYRLNLLPIELPPLRKRLDDIPELVKELLRHLESKGYNAISVNAAAIEAFKKHKWPGNVRELANLIERLCIMHSQGVIGLRDLPLEYQLAADSDEVLLQDIAALGEAQQKQPANKARSDAHNNQDAGTGKDQNSNQPVVQNQAADVVPAYNQQTASVVEQVAVEQPVAVTIKPQPVSVSNKLDATSAMMSLNGTVLQHYLFNFEKQLLLTALDDCANIRSFAAERLHIQEAELTEKIKAYNLESF